MSTFKQAVARRRAQDPEFRAGFDASRQRHQLVQQLVHARRSAGMTQGKVAEAMGVGQSTVSEFEASNDPRLSTIQRYAQAVNVRVFIGCASAQSLAAPTSRQPHRDVWQMPQGTSEVAVTVCRRSSLAQAA